MYRRIVLASTFLSGLAGLAYQMYWQRYLSFLVGSEARSIAMVVAIFLLGLATGYEFWGRFTSKIQDRCRLLRYYGVIELGIGAFAILFPFYFIGLQAIVYGSPNHFLLDLLITFFAIFLPTFLMGGTVPILTSYFPNNETEINDAHAKIYGLNSLGAFFGVFIGTFFIPSIGISVAIIVTGVLNILIGVFFFFNKQKGSTVKNNDVPKIPNSLDDKHVYALVFVTGMISLGMEVILVRALGLAMGMNFMVFPIILSLFILGLAWGSLSLRKSNEVSMTYVVNQILKVIVFSLIIFVTIPLWPTWINHIRVLMPSSDFHFYVYHVLVYFLMAVLVLPTIFYFGRLLPLSYSLLNKDGRNYGKKCGKLYFFNTFGTLIGSLCFGYLFLYFLNIDDILKISILILFLVALLLLQKEKIWHIRNVFLGLFLILCLFHDWDRSSHHVGLFRQRTATVDHFKNPFKAMKAKGWSENILFFEDGPNMTVTVLEYGPKSLSLITNGKSDGTTGNVGDVTTMNLLGILPYLYAGAEKKLQTAVVGQGLGITAGLLGKLKDVDQVDMIEISPTVLKTNQLFASVNNQAFNNPKIIPHEMDAFKFFANSERNAQYDIISSEPSNPWVVGIENLYTDEYYELLKKSLKPSGVLAQWMPVYSSNNEIVFTILQNLRKHFTHVEIYWGGVNDIIFLARQSTNVTKLSIDRWNEEFVQKEIKGFIAFPQKEFFQWHKVYSSDMVDAILLDRSIRSHNFNKPTLNFRATKAFFKGSTSHPDMFLQDYKARYLLDNGTYEKLALIQAHEKQLREFCLQHKKMHDSLTICQMGAAYWGLFKKLKVDQSMMTRVTAYTSLRNMGVIPPNIQFLQEIWSSVFNETDQKKKQLLADKLLDELMLDRQYELAMKLIDLYEKENIISTNTAMKNRDKISKMKNSMIKLLQ